MKLQDQVCTLEQAKQLKELGVNAETAFYFFREESDKPYARQGSIFSGMTHEQICKSEFSPAFTVAELGVMLPTTLSFNGTQKASIDYGWMNAFYITYRRHSSLKYCTKIIENVREAAARADMLIHLLESGLTSPAEVNARLQ